MDEDDRLRVKMKMKMTSHDARASTSQLYLSQLVPATQNNSHGISHGFAARTAAHHHWTPRRLRKYTPTITLLHRLLRNLFWHAVRFGGRPPQDTMAGQSDGAFGSQPSLTIGSESSVHVKTFSKLLHEFGVRPYDPSSNSWIEKRKLMTKAVTGETMP